MKSSGPQVKVQFPEKLQMLFQESRYKILYGGRGGAKSWGIARALLIKGLQNKLLIVCCREIQDSIEESVHRLLSNQIEAMQFKGFYEIQKNKIIGKNGTEFVFEGLKHKVDSIKSLEGCDICWVEEAFNVSHETWMKLIPTVRKPGSEIWISFNPELATDDTYIRFVVSPPKSAVLCEMNWRDNPWFPEVLRDEMLELKAKNYDEYLHVWEGKTVQMLEGAVYKNELRKLTQENRICRVTADEFKPVDVFCDLGWADNTSLWFIQKSGMDYRVLLSYQNQFQKWEHYLKYIEDTKYRIGTVFLPHDGKAKNIQTGKSIEDITRAANYKCRVVPAVSIIEGINMVRTVFGQCYFDEAGTVDGLQALRHYKYEKKPDGSFTQEPKHDAASHFADAFKTFATGFNERAGELQETTQRVKAKLKAPTVEIQIPMRGSTGWMR